MVQKIILTYCMNAITRTGCRRRMDCDTYGRRLRGGYDCYQFKEAYEAYGMGNCKFISEELPPGFPKELLGEILLQRTLQRLWTASRSLRHSSDTKQSSIRGTDQNNSIHPLRKNIAMPTRDVYYVILEKCSYTHEDARLHTLISYVLLVLHTPTVKGLTLFALSYTSYSTINTYSVMESKAYKLYVMLEVRFKV